MDVALDPLQFVLLPSFEALVSAVANSRPGRSKNCNQGQAVEFLHGNAVICDFRDAQRRE